MVDASLPLHYHRPSLQDPFASIIAAFSFLQGYTAEGGQILLESGKVQQLPPGEVLFLEGDPPNSVLLVLTSKLQVYVERQGTGPGFDRC